jgi:hypothetical protein
MQKPMGKTTIIKSLEENGLKVLSAEEYRENDADDDECHLSVIHITLAPGENAEKAIDTVMELAEESFGETKDS